MKSNQHCGRSRRLFLRNAAASVAGVCATSIMSVETAAGRETYSCPTVPIPMKNVDGKVAFISGGSSGIGLGIARALFDAGMNVVISYRTREHLDEAMKYFNGARERIHAVKLDVTEQAEVEAAAADVIKVFGKVHLLVNNAGVYGMGPLSEATRRDWDWMMNVNLVGVFNCVSAFLPYMRAHGEGGQIVTTASMWGLYAVDKAAIYCASKAAAIMLMEVLREELQPLNIGVSVYCPGSVLSRGWNADRNRPPDPTGATNKASTASSDEVEARLKKLRDDGALMDPLEAGRIVLNGIKNNFLHILSHPEYEQVIRDRAEALLASVPTNIQAPAARIAIERATLYSPTYPVERDRRRCLARAAGQRRGATTE